VITWVGNVWLWFAALALAATLAGRRIPRRDGAVWPLLALAVLMSILMTILRMADRLWPR
jgi:drug/metabolite transporter (DMT)-like permease